jgi:hypothetical protein
VSTVEEIERIVFALDDLIEEIVKRIQTRPANPGKLTATPIKIRTLHELAAREDAEVSEMLDDPVGAACRHSIRRLGELLYDITKSTDVMSDVLERVADRDPSRYSLRATILDKSWNGIGEGQDRWWS